MKIENEELLNAFATLGVGILQKLWIFILLIGSFFAPHQWILWIIGLLVVADTYLGVKCAKKAGIEITSNRFSDVYAKIIGYFIVMLIAVILAEKFDNEKIVWLAGIFPAGTELFSIDEKQRKMGKIGLIATIKKIFNFALEIKKGRDKLR